MNSTVNADEPTVTPAETVTVYPNPATDWFVISFENEELNQLTISLFDLQGKLVKQLLNEPMKRGDFKFSFGTNQLAKGTYVLQIQSGNKNLKNEKIIIQ